MKCSQVLSIINGLLLSTNVVAFTWSPVINQFSNKHLSSKVLLTSERAGPAKLVAPHSHRINLLKS